MFLCYLYRDATNISHRIKKKTNAKYSNSFDSPAILLVTPMDVWHKASPAEFITAGICAETHEPDNIWNVKKQPAKKRDES
jgi:hypothetical protein